MTLTPPLRRLVIATLPIACAPQPISKPTAPPVADEPEPGPPQEPARLPTPSFVAGPLEVQPAEAGDGLLPDDPTARVEQLGGTMMDHATRFGWSRDGQVFAICIPSGGVACIDCHFAYLDGRREKIWALAPDTPEEDAEGCTAADAREVERRFRVQDIGVHTKQWGHGGELVVDWRVSETEERSTLVVGTRVRDSGPAGWAVRMQEPMPSLHPEVMILDASASHLAVVSHGFAGEFSDTFRIELVATGVLAASGYQAAGVQALADERVEAAIEQLSRATAADGASWQAPLHLSRAYLAAGDHDRAALALREAIERDSLPARRRAATDPAFEDVHHEPWFTDLLGDQSPAVRHHAH